MTFNYLSNDIPSMMSPIEIMILRQIYGHAFQSPIVTCDMKQVYEGTKPMSTIFSKNRPLSLII